MQGFLEVTFSIAHMRICMAHRYSLLFDSNLLTHRIGFEVNRPKQGANVQEIYRYTATVICQVVSVNKYH